MFDIECSMLNVSRQIGIRCSHSSFIHHSDFLIRHYSCRVGLWPTRFSYSMLNVEHSMFFMLPLCLIIRQLTIIRPGKTEKKYSFSGWRILLFLFLLHNWLSGESKL